VQPHFVREPKRRAVWSLLQQGMRCEDRGGPAQIVLDGVGGAGLALLKTFVDSATTTTCLKGLLPSDEEASAVHRPSRHTGAR
jgi:hypothetical protein